MKNKLMQYATKEEIISCAISLLDNQIRESDVLCSPKQTREFLTLQLAGELAEVFCVLFLDNRHRVISFDRMFNGTIDGASVYPREVVRSAIKHNASAVIFAHNHPSGVAEPSSADEKITKRLTDAFALIDVRVLDHFIVGEEVVSMAERGLM
jgi:DNA repair protein RadC